VRTCGGWPAGSHRVTADRPGTSDGRPKGPAGRYQQQGGAGERISRGGGRKP